MGESPLYLPPEEGRDRGFLPRPPPRPAVAALWGFAWSRPRNNQANRNSHVRQPLDMPSINVIGQKR